MKCALIAKDPDLILCEYKTTDCSESLHDELLKRLHATKYPLDKSQTKEGDFICIKNDILIFACAATNSIKEEKLPVFLDELKDSFAMFYKIGLEKIHQQTNLTPNVLDVPFRRNFDKLFRKYNTGINMSVIQQAKAKVDDLKVDLNDAIKKQLNSNKATVEFEDTAETINLHAKLFEKETKELETIARKRNWWCCSCACISTFIIAGAAVVGGIVAIAILI